MSFGAGSVAELSPWNWPMAKSDRGYQGTEVLKKPLKSEDSTQQGECIFSSSFKSLT